MVILMVEVTEFDNLLDLEGKGEQRGFQISDLLLLTEIDTLEKDSTAWGKEIK